MWQSINQLRRILLPGDFRRLIFLLVPMIVVSLLELLGVFSILPFMQMVTKPEIVETDSRFATLKGWMGIEDFDSFIFAVGVIILCIYAVTAVFKSYVFWLIQAVVWSVAHRISVRLLDCYTRSEYEFFLTYNSAEMVKKAIADIQQLVTGVIMMGCQFVANLSRALAILLFLFILNPFLALMAFGVFGGVYVLIHLYRHRYLKKLGEERLETISVRIQSFSEVLSGIKTLRVAGATGSFVKRFEDASDTFCKIQPKYQLYNAIPRNLVELLAFGGIILVILYQLSVGQDLSTIIPTLSVFAMATYKLLPALSTAFTQAAALSHNLPVLNDVEADIKRAKNLLPPINEFASATPIKFDDGIQLDNVTYRYVAHEPPVLRKIDLKIPKNAKIAFVGATGCGKSTLMDILVGLLQPTEGALKVDGETVTMENVYGWQKRIAYVPQDVFLYDDTIAANIALGVDKDKVDHERLIKSAEIAKVDEFVTSELREGFDTLVGEHGVRLSGGQRQRIGLARAFYKRPDVLFLDEATSALDSITEDSVVTAMNEHLEPMTIVMIAHRLSSTKFCDKIILFEDGQIVESGTFDSMVESNAKFRAMVEVNEVQ